MVKKVRLPVQVSLEEKDGVEFSATANPLNKENAKLHKNRYREDEQAADEQILAQKRKEKKEIQDKTDWKVDHRLLLEEMDVSKFTLSPNVQRLLYKIQTILVDNMYNKWGKTEKSWDGYTLMFRNGFPSKDERKPVQEMFQMYCEEIYCPIFWCLLFGPGWSEISKHWAQFKACTIKVCESGMLYGENIFHMHIDGKIGMLQKKNYTQKHMSRLLFSIVSDVASNKVSFEDALKDPYHYGTTNYPIWQPRVGFKSNHEFHSYMQKYYVERGLENIGLPRPHYEIPEHLLYRAKSGEVIINRSHADPEYGCQPIHSEPNPCPDRHFFSFDWNNIIVNKTGGVPSIEVPEKKIIEFMKPLEQSFDSPQLIERLEQVSKICNDLLLKTQKYDQTLQINEAIQNVIQLVNDTKLHQNN